MLIGLIADTHNHFDPRLPEWLHGVDHILHAGDIGQPRVLMELEAIAPVTAVLGNNDSDPTLRETEVVELGGRRLLVHHIFFPPSPTEALARRIAAAQPDVVVTGHTHQRHCQTIGGRLFINPGYAGAPRPGLVRSLGLLRLNAAAMQVEFRDL